MTKKIRYTLEDWLLWFSLVFLLIIHSFEMDRKRRKKLEKQQLTAVEQLKRMQGEETYIV